MIATLSGRGITRRRLWTLVVVLLFVGLTGLAGYFALRHAWACQHYREALAALEAYNPEAAADHLAMCLEVWPHDRTTLLLAARTARRADRLEEAQRLQEVCRARHGPSPELTLEFRLLAAQKGQLQDLEQFLSKLVADNHPDTPLIVEALNQGYIKTVRGSEAFRCANALLRLQPNHPRAYAWRGWAWEHYNRNEKALDDYRQAVNLKPDFAAARQSLGVMLLKLQRFPEALEQFQWLQERQPRDPDIGLGVARCLRGVGQMDQARVLLDELIGMFPEEGVLLSERGQLALEEGNLDQAEHWLRRAVPLIVHDHLTHYALFRCLQQLGQEEEANQHFRLHEQLVADVSRLKDLEKELAKPGLNADRRREAGVLCFRLGRQDEGVRYLFAALQDDPSHGPSHQALAEHFEQTGKPGLAAQHRAASSH